MPRPLLAVSALLVAAALAPSPCSAAAPTSGSTGPAGVLVTLASLSAPWDLIWEWLGIRPQCIGVRDPNGGCTAQVPVRPSVAGIRPQCGGLIDPNGRCTAQVPVGPSAAGRAVLPR
jgi:hypothetical protein